MSNSSGPYKIFMLVHDRPIYCYMTLDSLQRATYSPFQLTVIHHRRGPGLTDQVLEGFRSRGIIHQVIEITGDFVDGKHLFREHRKALEPSEEFVFFIEEDVVIEPAETCWVAAMVEAMQNDPKLAFVGSAIDKRDFVDLGALANELGRPLTPRERALIKADSPERSQDFAPGQRLFTAHNPPGRLFGLRIAAMTETTWDVDSLMDKKLRAQGWRTGILRDVRHRHMSLQNYYDYPEYIEDREQHFNRVRGEN